ncbi:jg9794 [Pararge aegeria aegeria]|uniref:Alanine--glyoxylate aminotransferase 2, mitochondrial n=1 Tax=Pararge aegeria aegeria TaxID=348720 RepID=A0A8S4RN01_9NEOP|nr:jg9794 [Pararge aegeria aegeria]
MAVKVSRHCYNILSRRYASVLPKCDFIPNKKVTAALHKQIDTLWHTTNIYRHPQIYEYVEKLTAKFPGDLKVVYLVNSGTEANDLAILLAKSYTGNHDVISLQSSYHGYSSVMIGLTAQQSYRTPLPVPAGIHHVQTGFGRTGDAFWGFESHGVVPDIVTLAKGIGNGFPLAAVVTTKEIAQAHAKATYFNTFGGNPMASAVGKAVLEVIDEENLQQNCKETGKYFIEQLMALQKVYPVIGDVRGKGLMLAIEMVEPGTKDPLNKPDFANILEMIKDSGVLIGTGGRWGNVLRIKPPMCINKDDVNFAMSVLDQSLNSYSKNLKNVN